MACVTRFAPSPTGPLHLGHAYAALFAAQLGDRFLLRIEDTDQTRCRQTYEQAILDDLDWLGLTWEEPVLRQSSRLDAYAQALDKFTAMGLTYHCTCTRRDIAASAPHGVTPAYPGTCRAKGHASGTLRLNMARATAALPDLTFTEKGRAQVFNPSQLTDDIILHRPGEGFAYHLVVVLDDAFQGVTLVTRGEDLLPSTPIHVVLQRLLGLPSPAYHHHRLILDAQGRRLAKRDDARALTKYRADGATPQDVRKLVGM